MRRSSGLLVALLCGAACNAVPGCGGGGGAPQQAPAQQPAAAAAKDDGIQASWLGYLSRTYEGNLTQCTESTRAALRRLGLEVVQESGGIFEKDLDAESRDGTSLVVELKEVTKETTRVSVKVGYFLGDRDAARRIQSEIQSELGARRDEAVERAKRWKSVPGGAPPASGAGGGTK